MPFRFEDGSTPQGHPCLIIHGSGVVALADAEALAAYFAPGARYHGKFGLSILEKGTEFASEARAAFPSMRSNFRAIASVVTSPIVRGMINLLLRLSKREINYRMVPTRDEAMAWLDGQSA
jgi:hypothetical protein